MGGKEGTRRSQRQGHLLYLVRPFVFFSYNLTVQSVQTVDWLFYIIPTESLLSEIGSTKKRSLYKSRIGKRSSTSENNCNYVLTESFV